MIKVLYFKNHLRKVGGIERIWINKMNYLSKESNYKIYIVTTAQENFDPIYPLSHKVEHIDLDICLHHAYYFPKILRPFIKTWKNLIFFIRLQKTLKEINPDFIIIDSTSDPMVFKISHHAKIIAESHTAKSFIHNENRDYKRMFNNYEKKADIVVSLTQGEAKEWNNAKIVKVIPNFIEKQLEPTCVPKDFKRVISSGRLVAQKRQEDLIIAWKEVVQKHPEWKLDIYGEGERIGILQNKINEFNLHQYIRILPPTESFFEELRHCDFFAMSSLYEGFSLVLAEAMMVGIPCISYDCPYGPSDLINNKHDGLLVPSGNTEQLSKAILWMIEHPEQRIQMGKYAYQSIQRFTPEKIIPKWKELFEEYLEDL